MKKPAVLLCVLLLISVIIAPSAAAKNDGDGIEWDGKFAYVSDGDGARIVACTQTGAVTVPEKVGGLPVISLNSGVFFYRNDITSVHIPSGVERLGGQQFSGCRSLASLTVAEGNRVFTSVGGVLYTDGGKTLRFHPPAMAGESFAVPDGVTKLAARSFLGSNALYGVTLPESLAVIGKMAFYSCGNLRSVKLPDSLEEIGECAFEFCTNLRAIELPEGFSQIGRRAFGGTYYVNDIEEDFVTIGDGILLAYKGTERDVILPDSIKILLDAFAENEALRSVTLPQGLERIGDCAFRNCSELKSITLPYGVSSVGARAFYGCDKLAEVVIPDSVESIGEEAFIYCANLAAVSTCASVIGESAFESCDSLTAVTLAQGVKNIGEYAFANCGALKEIELPEGTESVGKRAFLHCGALTVATLPSTVKTVGQSAFAQCGEVTLRVTKKSAALKYAKEAGLAYEVTGNGTEPQKDAEVEEDDDGLIPWLEVGLGLIDLFAVLLAAVVLRKKRRAAKRAATDGTEGKVAVDAAAEETEGETAADAADDSAG